MEDVLDLYAEPYDPRRPVVCFDETSTQLLAETRAPLPAGRGRPRREVSTAVGSCGNFRPALLLLDPFRFLPSLGTPATYVALQQRPAAVWRGLRSPPEGIVYPMKNSFPSACSLAGPIVKKRIWIITLYVV